MTEGTKKKLERTVAAGTCRCGQWSVVANIAHRGTSASSQGDRQITLPFEQTKTQRWQLHDSFCSGSRGRAYTFWSYHSLIARLTRSETGSGRSTQKSWNGKETDNRITSTAWMSHGPNIDRYILPVMQIGQLLKKCYRNKRVPHLAQVNSYWFFPVRATPFRNSQQTQWLRYV